MSDCLQHGWAPSEWQEHVNALLYQHFCILGLQYQRVPDLVGGDGGLEGYSSDGQGFQAFADQGSNTKAERLKKQVQKITGDLQKLYKYKDEWLARLGDVKLKSWTLVVPLYEDKAILAHAIKRAGVVREQHLSFISEKFCAYVSDERAFPLALKQITDNGTPKIKLSARTVDPSQISAYEQSQSKDIAIIDAKLLKVPVLKTKSGRLACRRDYLKRYLFRENLLEELRKRHPTLRQQIDELLAAKGEDILTDTRLESSPPNLVLLSVKEGLQKDLREIAAGLSTRDNSAIAYGTVGHWLLNCNLQFYE